MNASAEKQVKRGVVAAAAVNHPVFVFYDMFKKSAPPLTSVRSSEGPGRTTCWTSTRRRDRLQLRSCRTSSVPGG